MELFIKNISTLILLIIIVSNNLYACYLVSFNAIDASNKYEIKLDSIRIIKRTGEKETLVYPENLIYDVGKPLSAENDILLIENNNLNYPNPVINSTKFDLNFEESGTLVTQISDLMGRVLFTSSNEIFAGNYDIIIDIGNLLNGNYLVRFSTKNKIQNNIITKIGEHSNGNISMNLLLKNNISKGEHSISLKDYNYTFIGYSEGYKPDTIYRDIIYTEDRFTFQMMPITINEFFHRFTINIVLPQSVIQVDEDSDQGYGWEKHYLDTNVLEFTHNDSNIKYQNNNFFWINSLVPYDSDLLIRNTMLFECDTINKIVKSLVFDWKLRTFDGDKEHINCNFSLINAPFSVDSLGNIRIFIQSSEIDSLLNKLTYKYENIWVPMYSVHRKTKNYIKTLEYDNNSKIEIIIIKN